MTFRTSTEYQRAWEELRRNGLLLLQDPKLPSVASLVAGTRVRGSWWGHPAGRKIYGVSTQLAEHPESLVTKLLSGKVTFVHRRLWPAFLALARSREPWQMQRLPPACRTLLRRLDREGELDPRNISAAGLRTPRETVGELERRLLIHAEEIHTESGAHAKRLESWDHWTERTAWPGPHVDARVGREHIVDAVRRLCRESGGSCRLPWEGASVR